MNYLLFNKFNISRVECREFSELITLFKSAIEFNRNYAIETPDGLYRLDLITHNSFIKLSYALNNLFPKSAVLSIATAENCNFQKWSSNGAEHIVHISIKAIPNVKIKVLFLQPKI